MKSCHICQQSNSRKAFLVALVESDGWIESTFPVMYILFGQGVTMF